MHVMATVLLSFLPSATVHARRHPQLPAWVITPANSHFCYYSCRLARIVLLILIIPMSHAHGARTPQQKDLRFKNLEICNEDAIVAQYRIDDSPTCDALQPEESYTFAGDIFYPPQTQIKIKATTCSIRKDSASYTAYFFGGESTQDESTQFLPPSQKSCREWERQRISPFGNAQVTTPQQPTNCYSSITSG